MASVYSRERKSGTFWYVGHAGDTYSGGKGSRGEKDAREIAVELERRDRRARAGIIEPKACHWTIGDLFDRIDKESRARDPKSTRAFRLGRIKAIRERFPDATRLDAITRGMIDEAARYMIAHPKRPKKATAGGKVGANRTMVELRRALRMAREDWGEESGYRGDPFRGWEPYDEKPTRRKVVPIDDTLRAKIIEAARAVAREVNKEHRAIAEADADMIELYFLTGSRLSEVMRAEKAWIRGGVIVFPPAKRGEARAFALEGRLAAIVNRRTAGPSRYLFPAKGLRKRRGDHPRDNFGSFLLKLRQKLELPTLTAHHFRHAVVTGESAAGMSDEDLMRIMGWTTTQMLRVYRHPAEKTLSPIDPSARALPDEKKPKRKNSAKA